MGTATADSVRQEAAASGTNAADRARPAGADDAKAAANGRRENAAQRRATAETLRKRVDRPRRDWQTAPMPVRTGSNPPRSYSRRPGRRNQDGRRT